MKESEQFRKGVALFNARKFFEAHEVWEELWLVEPEPEKAFLQGLIQLAAAFHHHSRENLHGTRSLLAAGLIKLGRFPHDHHGIALAAFCAEAGEWAEVLNGGKDLVGRRPPEIHVIARSRRKKKRGI